MGLKPVLNIDFEFVVSRQLIGKISKRSHHSTHALQEGHDTDQTEKAHPTLWDEARRKCVFEGRGPGCQDGQEAANAACSQNASAVGFQEEADEFGHALETWSDATTEHWVSFGRKSQISFSGMFATFRMKLVLGETFMPLGCVILEGGGNADLRSWKAFGQWVNTIRRASPKSVTPEHALYAVRKIVIFIQGGDTLSKNVMEDLSSEERRSVVDESSSTVLSLLKRESIGANCQELSERVRRFTGRALQKGLECSSRAIHKWLSQALKGGAGPAHRWCGKEDALAELLLFIRDSQGNFTA